MRVRRITLTLLAAVIVIAAGLQPPRTAVGQTATPVMACPGAPLLRLARQGKARVTPGQPDNLRDIASIDANVIGQVTGGTELIVFNGPVCSDGYAWWQVKTLGPDPVRTGWIAEGDTATYFVEPVEPPPPTATPAQIVVPKGADNTEFKYGNVSLTYQNLYNGHVNASFVPDYGNPDGPIGLLPAHIEITFGSPHDERTPTLAIYPIRDYQQLNPQADCCSVLRSLLKRQPATTPVIHWVSGNQDNEIPVLNGCCAVQLIHARLAYLKFDGGMGVRFLTEYAQQVYPILNQNLYYYFQGLTTDGRYYISLTDFPVNAAVVSNNYDDDTDFSLDMLADGKLYETYLDKKTKLINSAAPEGFSPRLELIDSMIESLRIN